MLSCTFSLLNLPLTSQCLTQQTEFEWPCLWMVGRSCMTDHPVWTQLWSFFSLSLSPENRPWLWVLFHVFGRHSQNQWFSHSLYVNMQKPPCICRYRWTSELITVWYGGGGRHTQRDGLLLLRWVFPMQPCVSTKVPERSRWYSGSSAPQKRKTIQLTRKCLRMGFFSRPLK